MGDKIIGLYAAGLSTRDIRAHLEEVYGFRVSTDLISRVTDAVLDEVTVSLHDVLNWKVGSRLDLQVNPETTVDLRCGENSMFRGKTGRKGGNIAVRIDQKLDRPQVQ